jgi:hypothetical protein
VTAIVIVAWTWGEPQKKEPVGLGTAPAQTPVVVKPHTTTAQAVRLIMTAKRGNCWLEVPQRFRDGTDHLPGTLERGQRKLFSGHQLWITLDRPENVGNRPQRPLPHSSRRRRQGR